MLLFLKKSLAKRFIFFTSGVISILLTLFASLTIFLYIQFLERNLAKQLEGAIHFIELNLTSALWQFNTDYIDEFVESIFLFDNLIYIKINTNDLIIAEQVRSPETRVNIQHKVQNEHHLTLQKTLQLKKDGYLVGQVELVFSKEFIFISIRNGIVITLVILLSMICTISLVLYLTFKKYIFTPIKNLEHVTTQIGLGDLEHEISYDSKDEIGQLTANIDQMRLSLKTSISVIQQTQQELLKKEKLAAIGKLSGSVAHDIRNPLGVLSNSIYYLSQITDKNTAPKLTKHIRLMEQEIQRANSIITDLMDFSKANAPKKQLSSINQCITQSLFKTKVLPQIEISLELDNELPSFLFDFSQIQRVLINLISNAQDAIGDTGTITISSKLKTNEVLVSVKDTGHGIEESDLVTIFEPLFTTKRKGVGLGLSIVKTFVKRHGGDIAVVSSSEGTTITITLPVDEDIVNV